MASESLTQLLTRNDSMSERTRTRNHQAVVIRFTSKSLEDLKPRPHPSRFIAWDKDHRGFGVRITPQGTKTFVYVYRFDGASRLLSIGNTPPLTLEEARSAFAEAQAKLMRAKHQRRHEGIAPSEELDPAATRSSGARSGTAVRRAMTSLLSTSGRTPRPCAQRPATRTRACGGFMSNPCWEV